MRIGPPDGPWGAGQHLQPGRHAAAAVQVWRWRENGGRHHLLHLAGQHPAAGLHLRPHGVCPSRRALLAGAAVLLQRRPVRLAEQQLRQLLVGGLAERPLLCEGPDVLLGSLQGTQGEHLVCAQRQPAADPADLLRDVHPFPLPPLSERHAPSERDRKGWVRHREAPVPRLGQHQCLRGGLHLLPGPDALNDHAPDLAEAGCLSLQTHVIHEEAELLPGC